MRVLVAGSCIALAACGFNPVSGAGGHDARIDGASPSDGLSDAPNDGQQVTQDGSTCYGTGPVRVCPAQPPTDPVTLSTPGTTLNTDQAQSCAYQTQTGNPSTLCVVLATDITFDAYTYVTGTHPLVLVASGKIVVTGSAYVDASSHSASGTEPDQLANTGPNSNPAGCALVNGGSSQVGAGGGAGGTGATPGGNGGRSVASGGQAPAAPAASDIVRGGCSGGNGGSSARAGGRGGVGGGAIYLIASEIDLNNMIDASAEGGTGGGAAAGGAGGGAGGLIVLDAPTVTINSGGGIVAEGGGGGQGGDAVGTGEAGTDGGTIAVRAPGGSSGGGGAGGDGAAGGSQGNPGTLGTAGAGGGGGGGGDGRIRFFQHAPIIDLSEVSPPPS